MGKDWYEAWFNESCAKDDSYWNTGISALADMVLGGVSKVNNLVSDIVDVEREEGKIVVSVLASGLKKEDLAVSYKVENGHKFLLVDYKVGNKFVTKGVKKIYVNEIYKIEDMKAKMENGILLITIPEDSEKNKRGEVNID
jgi:HSP20 family molecular chaperone IbpA